MKDTGTAPDMTSGAALKGVPSMAGQRPSQYNTVRIVGSDDKLDREWRGPGCSVACKRIRALVIGEAHTRYIELHDTLAHEDYGIGLGARGAYRNEIVRTGGLVVDIPRWTVSVNGRSVYLNQIERRIILYLAEHLDEVIVSPELIRAVWGDDDRLSYVQANANGALHFLRTQMSRLRRAIHPCSDLIVTTTGVGYRLRTVEPTDAYGATVPARKWARFFDRCQGCGTTDRPHLGHGLCPPCLWQWRKAHGSQ